MNLKPCPYRQVNDEGRILCDQITSGDREVSPAICRACPVAQINCAHLRAALRHQARTPITVRYGNGKTEIWDDPTPPIALERAACSAQVIPILSPSDCAGCPIRHALVANRHVAIGEVTGDDNTTKDRRRKTNAMTGAPIARARTHTVAQKIIQLQEWLAKSKAASLNAEEKGAVRPIAVSAGRGVVPSRDEEKRVGWTD